MIAMKLFGTFAIISLTLGMAGNFVDAVKAHKGVSRAVWASYFVSALLAVCSLIAVVWTYN